MISMLKLLEGEFKSREPCWILKTLPIRLDSISEYSKHLSYILVLIQFYFNFDNSIVWLSPIYTSPMKDMGYDISDYRAINPTMGTLEDWENMVAKAHELGLKIVMDLVVNHTSDQHEWFLESKKGGKGGSKRDWYYWKPRNVKTGKEPNNWGKFLFSF